LLPPSELSKPSLGHHVDGQLAQRDEHAIHDLERDEVATVER
jgi:hypothetical protein